MARVLLLLALCSYSAAEDSKIDWSKVIDKSGGALKNLIQDDKGGSPALTDIADTMSGLGDLTSQLCPGPVGALFGAGLGAVGGILKIFSPSKPQTSLDDVLNAVTQGFKYTDSILDTISTNLDTLTNDLAAYVADLKNELSSIKVLTEQELWITQFGSALTDIAGRYEAVQQALHDAMTPNSGVSLQSPIQKLQEVYNTYDDKLQTDGTLGSRTMMKFVLETMIPNAGTGAALFAYERIMTGRVQLFVMMQIKQQFDIMNVTSVEEYDTLLNATRTLIGHFEAGQKEIQASLPANLLGYLGQQEVQDFLSVNNIQLITGSGFELNGRYMLAETKTSLEEALKATPPAGFKPSKRVLIVTWSGAERQFLLMTGKQQWNPSETVPQVEPWYGDMITASGMLRWPENSGVHLLTGGVDSLQYCASSGIHPMPSSIGGFDVGTCWDHSSIPCKIECRDEGVPGQCESKCWQCTGSCQAPAGSAAKCYGCTGSCPTDPIAPGDCHCLVDLWSNGANGMVMFHHSQGAFWNPSTKQIQLGDVLLINHNGQKHFYGDIGNVCDTSAWSQIDDKVFYLTLSTAKLVQPISASPSRTVYV